MATSIPPILINPLTPVTPPPEHQVFHKPFLPLSSQSRRKAPPDIQTNLQHTHAPHSAQTAHTPTLGLAHTSHPVPTIPTKPGPATSLNDNVGTSSNLTNGAPSQPIDPRYVQAMVSRVAAFYQQRCQAISNAQQQRCQAWATAQRQKYQDTMQAATLVVAWYIRDRIRRRRRKEKRTFRAGLRTRGASSHRITKGESVRRWVMKVPEDATAHDVAVPDGIADGEEASFSMDRAPVLDKDAKLFETADHLIKSQYRRIDVPMLGVLSFEESESESDEDQDMDEDGPDDFDKQWDEPQPKGLDQYEAGLGRHEEEAEEEEDYDYEDDYDDDDDDDDDVSPHENDLGNKESGGPCEDKALGSQTAQLGTTINTGSQSNNRSPIP